MEVLFLKHHNHPNLVKLIGCCDSDELLATVYDISPLDTLHNLLDKGSVLFYPFYLSHYTILCHNLLNYVSKTTLYHHIDVSSFCESDDIDLLYVQFYR